MAACIVNINGRVRRHAAAAAVVQREGVSSKFKTYMRPFFVGNPHGIHSLLRTGITSSSVTPGHPGSNKATYNYNIIKAAACSRQKHASTNPFKKDTRLHFKLKTLGRNFQEKKKCQRTEKKHPRSTEIHAPLIHDHQTRNSVSYSNYFRGELDKSDTSQTNTWTTFQADGALPSSIYPIHLKTLEAVPSET